MIRVVNLTQHYGIRPVLRNLNMEIAPGELVAVMGPNGMGKSTLLGAMAGVLSPQKGHVEIDGLVRRSSESNEIVIRGKVVYLPADAWLPASVTARDYLLAMGRLYNVDDDRLFDHIDRLLRLFDLEMQGDSTMTSLSTGQKKKVALSGALITDAEIMLLDEPFAGGLDPSGILALKHVLKRMAETRDRTVVIAVPVPALVEEIATRIAILRHGEVAAFGTVEELKETVAPGETLEVALERLINPQTMSNLAHYFEGERR